MKDINSAGSYICTEGTVIGCFNSLIISPQRDIDTTPGGTTDVWLWEDGIGMLWENNAFIITE